MDKEQAGKLHIEKNTSDWKPQDADKGVIKQQIRDRVRNTTLGENAVLIPAKPKPTIDDKDAKVVAVYARVSTSSTEQVSSIENQTKYYTEKIEKNPNWTMHKIYSDEGKSGTSMRKRTEFKRMLRDAKDKKMDLILCASVSRFARNVSDCIEQVDELRTQNPSHPVGVYFETENIYTLDEGSQQALGMHAMLADWESANKSRRMIISYDQRICMGQYPVSDLLGYRHTKDGQLVIQEEEAKTVRFIFLSYINGASYEEIAKVLTEKRRPTLKGRTEWNAAMVHSIMTNERRWGDLRARKRVVVNYKKGKTAKNNQIRDAAFVKGHHEGIVTPEIAKATQMLMASSYKNSIGVSDTAVIRDGALKGFISISPGWAGMDNESLLEICKSVYTDDELSIIEHKAKIQSGEEHSKVMSMQLSGYQVPYGAFFMNQNTPSLTITAKYIKFNKAAHKKLNNCRYIELLYHPILNTIAIRSCEQLGSNSFYWDTDKKKTSGMLAPAFCKSIFDKQDWIKTFQFRFRGISRIKGNSSIMMFYLDEPQILVDRATKEQYELKSNHSTIKYIPYRNSEISDNNSANKKIVDFGISVSLRKERDSLIDNITKDDIEVTGVSVVNPLIGHIPTKDEIQQEINNLLLSM